MLKVVSLYQDRLGTNIGRAERQRVACSLQGGLRKYKGQTTRAERLVELEWAKREDRVRKTASFFERFPYVCPEPVLAK